MSTKQVKDLKVGDVISFAGSGKVRYRVESKREVGVKVYIVLTFPGDGHISVVYNTDELVNIHTDE